MPMTGSQTKRYTHAEWRAEAERRFGSDPLKWRFVCPACGVTQEVSDFTAGENDAVAAQRAAQYCIGNYTDHDCDWKSFGLFRGPVFVDMAPNGGVPVFDFAPASA